jgi:predicted nucleotidyltransferase
LLRDRNSSSENKHEKDQEEIKERINALELEVFGSVQESVEDELDIDIEKIKFRPSGSDIVVPGPNLG